MRNGVWILQEKVFWPGWFLVSIEAHFPRPCLCEIFAPIELYVACFYAILWSWWFCRVMVAKPLSIDEQENAVVRSEPGRRNVLFLLLLLFIAIIVYLSWKCSGMICWKYFHLPVGIYLLKVNNRTIRTRCKICSKLTIKT